MISMYRITSTEDNNNNQPTCIIIDHCRTYVVENISRREIKHWGKLSRGKDYIILDKDYGKSAELARYVMEERKKMSIMWYVVLFLAGLAFLWFTAWIIMNAFTTKPTVTPTNSTNNIITPTPAKPIIVKDNSTGATTQTNIEVKTNTWIIVPIPDIQDIRDNEEYIMLNEQFFALQDTNKELSKNLEIVNYKYDMCSRWQVAWPSCTPTTIEVEKKLNSIEQFQLELWKKIKTKCDIAITQKNENAQMCKDIYAEFISNQ